jgi:hypothetical protein
MSHAARLGLLMTLVLSLAVLFGVPPAAANDQTCDKLISAPGANTVGITITAPGIYCPDFFALSRRLAACAGRVFGRKLDKASPTAVD